MAKVEGHSIRWFVVVGGEAIPRTSTMRGNWSYEAHCSCGWQTHWGNGDVLSYVRREVEFHKWEAMNA